MLIKLVIALSVFIVVCNGQREKCNATIVWFNCPGNISFCEAESNECACPKNYKVNLNRDPKSIPNGNVYCVKDNNKGQGAEEGEMSINPTNQLIQPPGSHHIIGGILIPILIVFLVVGFVLGVKKLRLIKRIREMITRKQRPYEDVIMGNDLDDPPLI